MEYAIRTSNSLDSVILLGTFHTRVINAECGIFCLLKVLIFYLQKVLRRSLNVLVDEAF